MKMAGRSRAGRKVSAAHRASVPGITLTPLERQAANRGLLSVTENPDIDTDLSEWFARADVTQVLTESEVAALDSMIESHGVAHLLDAIAQLCDSRVDASLIQTGRVIHHLARDDDYAYTAERLGWLIADERIKRLKITADKCDM